MSPGVARAVVLVTVIRSGSPVDLVVQLQRREGQPDALLVSPIGRLEPWDGRFLPAEVLDVEAQLAQAMRLAADDERAARARWARVPS